MESYGAAESSDDLLCDNWVLVVDHCIFLRSTNRLLRETVDCNGLLSILGCHIIDHRKKCRATLLVSLNVVSTLSKGCFIYFALK